jgi:4Fe-4S single cluster domain
MPTFCRQTVKPSNRQTVNRQPSNVFELHREEALWYDPAVSDEQLERLHQAAAACPVQAIVMGEGVSVGVR